MDHFVKVSNVFMKVSRVFLTISHCFDKIELWKYQIFSKR